MDDPFHFALVHAPYQRHIRNHAVEYKDRQFFLDGLNYVIWISANYTLLAISAFVALVGIAKLVRHWRTNGKTGAMLPKS